MAKVRGFTCDVCGEFDKADGTSDDYPIGWMTLKVHTAHDHTGNGNQKDLCSNDCLKKLARERAGDKVSGKKRTNSKAVVGTDGKKHTAQSHQRWHTNRGEINVDCPFCVEETEKSDSEMANA